MCVYSLIIIHFMDHSWRVLTDVNARFRSHHMLVLMFYTHTAVLRKTGLYNRPFTTTPVCNLKRHSSSAMGLNQEEWRVDVTLV